MATPRREFKYAITEDEALAIARWVEPYCDLDPFLSGDENQYTITTLYLDSPDRRYYWEKKTIQFARIKSRIRTYGPEAEGPVYAELKRRYGDVVVKSRAPVPRESWQALVDQERAAEIAAWDVPKKTRDVVEDFEAQVHSLALEPLVVVRYDRVPYVGRVTPRVRVTFDRGLRYCPVSRVELPSSDRRYRFMDFAQNFGWEDSRVILELKFDGHPPVWMRDLVSRFDLLRGAFSKYCTAVDDMISEPHVFTPGWSGSALE